MKKHLFSPNYEYFLKLKTASYKGKWIAITKNKVAAVSSRADEAFKAAKKKYPKSEISLAKVPQEETLMAWSLIEEVPPLLGRADIFDFFNITFQQKEEKIIFEESGKI